MSENRRIRKKLVIEGLIAFLIAMTPFFFYLYKYVPASAEQEWQVFGVTFTNNGYYDVQTAIYYYIGKLVPLVLLIVWFVTSKRWWYHAILIPIAMYTFQFYSVWNEDAAQIDENELLYLVPVCMVITVVIYFIRIKLVDRYVHGIDLEAMEAELELLRKKQGQKNTSSEEPSDDKPINLNGLPFTEKLNYIFSTGNIENQFRHFQHTLQNWFHLKF